MGTAAVIIGILALLGYFVTLIPGMKGFSYVSMPLAIIGVILGVLAIALTDGMVLGIIGLVFSLVSAVFGYLTLSGTGRLMGRPIT